ncbi:vitamin B12 dependent-methionine synthase activation domain-containing protein [Sporosarcina psychrophila]
MKRPEDIGMQLTEGLLMESKVCVSAMVFAHPDARCFLQRN